jgi:predicted PurR-regulated permease PerM
MIANPLVKFLEKKVKIIRKHGSAIIIVAVILIIFGVLSGAIYIIAKEAMTLVQDLPNIYKSLDKQFEELSTNLSGIYNVLPSSIQVFIDKLGNSFSEYGASIAEKPPITISMAGSLAKTVVEGFFMTIITILAAYFFTAERENIVGEVRKVMPKTVVDYYRLVANNFKTAVGGYFKAQFKIMIIIILIIFFGFELLQINYSFLLAIIIAVLLGNYTQAIFLMIIYLICQIVKQILQPKMVGDSIGINPLATLIFMFIGYRFMNVFGMIIGIPIGMVIVSLFRMGMFDNIIKGLKIIINNINEFRKY